MAYYRSERTKGMHVCEWMVYYVVYCFTELDTMLGDTQLEIVGKISLECIALHMIC